MERQNGEFFWQSQREIITLPRVPSCNSTPNSRILHDLIQIKPQVHRVSPCCIPLLRCTSKPGARQRLYAVPFRWYFTHEFRYPSGVIMACRFEPQMGGLVR